MMFGDRCTKPHQTGMEQKWEVWVLAVLNFLAEHEVDAYDGGWNSRSLEGMSKRKGQTLEIPARLNLLKITIATLRSEARYLRDNLYDEKEIRQSKEANLGVANELLERCYLNSSGSYDAKENLEVTEALESYAKAHLPHLFEEDEDDTDQRSA